MIRMIKVGIAYDFTGSRQFDLYITNTELIRQTKERVRKTYETLENAPKEDEKVWKPPKITKTV